MKKIQRQVRGLPQKPIAGFLLSYKSFHYDYNRPRRERHEKAGVTHLLGFFTEVKASRDICAEGLKILCSETFDFSPVLFA